MRCQSANVALHNTKYYVGVDPAWYGGTSSLASRWWYIP